MEREARLIACPHPGDGGRHRRPAAGAGVGPELKAYRPLRYRDIVILMRATTGRVNTVIEVLSQAGIPAYGQMATGYFQATEVQVFLSLLQILG